MKYIFITVKAKVEDMVFGKVSDENWEKYQNGEISANALYMYYFSEIDRTNLDCDITEIGEIEAEEED